MFGPLCAPFVSHYNDRRDIHPGGVHGELKPLLGHGYQPQVEFHVSPVFGLGKNLGDQHPESFAAFCMATGIST